MQQLDRALWNRFWSKVLIGRITEARRQRTGVAIQRNRPALVRLLLQENA